MEFVQGLRCRDSWHPSVEETDRKEALGLMRARTSCRRWDG